ncbi:MAG: hypothetical protein ABI217_02555 [Chthoniobacterales bacterium]
MDAPNKQEIIDSTIPPANPLESAILMTLNPEAYTAIVRGVNNTTTLELRNPDGSILASNDNWRETREAEIIATTVPPTDDLESAIVTTLPPDGYTAIVRGANGTTGVALVEVYALAPVP